MKRWRVESRTLCTLACVVLLLQASRSECQFFQTAPATKPGAAAPAPAAETSCVVYSLSDLGSDPSVGTWVADTLLKLMESGTWRGEGNGRWLLNYHPQARILFVQHTPAVQAKVESFLRDVRKSVPRAATPALDQDQQVIQAAGVVPVVPPAPRPQQLQQSQQPKHLFHFIIRYEGAGLDGSLLEQAADLAATSVYSDQPTVLPPPQCLPPPLPSGNVQLLRAMPPAR
jgi:hypothetical protein